MRAVARDAGTFSAQGTRNDTGVDDAVWRYGQQDAGSPGGLFAEALHVAALDEQAQPVLPSAATPDLREHGGGDDRLNTAGQGPLMECPHTLDPIFGGDQSPGVVNDRAQPSPASSSNRSALSSASWLIRPCSDSWAAIARSPAR